VKKPGKKGIGGKAAREPGKQMRGEEGKKGELETIQSKRPERRGMGMEVISVKNQKKRENRKITKVHWKR